MAMALSLQTIDRDIRLRADLPANQDSISTTSL